MNIIKFKENWFEDLKEPNSTNTFNKYFSNKYAIAARFEYVFTLDSISFADYMLVEQYGLKSFNASRMEYELDPDTGDFVYEEDSVEKKIKAIPYVDVTINNPEETVLHNVILIRYKTFEQYINTAMTTKVNSISKYIAENNYISDIDITLEELMNFRTWLATSVLDIEEADDEMEFGDDVKLMLNYYKSGMYDDVVKAFQALGQYAKVLNMSSVATNGCGCQSSANSQILNLLQGTTVGKTMTTLNLADINITTCDPVEMYRKYIYNCMVETFKDYKFWEQMPKPFILEFAKYIRGIIDNNLPLYQSQYLTTFADCACLNDPNASQLALQAILEKLYKSLMYIYNDEIKEHKNYMNEAFLEWSSRLYERMYWV